MQNHARATHGRLCWPTRGELDEQRRALYDAIVGGPRASGQPAFRLTDDAGRLEGPFNAMLVNPTLGVVVQELGAAIRYRTALSDRSREIAILTLAVERGSEFEWYAHERVAQRVGLTTGELAALRDGTDDAAFSLAERLVRRGVVSLCRDRDLSDDIYAALIEAIGYEQVGELLTLTGYYELLALSLQVWRTPLPAGEVTSLTSRRDTSPPSEPGSLDGKF